MTRFRPVALLFVLVCKSAPEPAVVATTPTPPTETVSLPPTPPAEKTLEERNRELLAQHDQIWDLMQLSPAAKKELTDIVLGVNTQLYKNKQEHPAEFAQAMEIKRAEKPLTHDEYVAAHKRRFDMLKITAPTQTELLAAAEFVWSALHDPSVPADKKKTAEIIRNMMKSMNGPPPCCDDNIFQRAGAHEH